MNPSSELREPCGKGTQKECRGQQGWRTPRKQGPLHQHEQSYSYSQEAQAACRACMDLHQVSWAYMLPSGLLFKGIFLTTGTSLPL